MILSGKFMVRKIVEIKSLQKSLVSVVLKCATYVNNLSCMEKIKWKGHSLCLSSISISVKQNNDLNIQIG